MKILKVAGELRTGFAFLLLSVLPLSTAWADSIKQASVTEAVNSVSYQTNANASQKAATVGTVVHSDNVVRTGIKSRAELTFNDNTVTRMGANSAFTFDAQSQKLNLEQGSMLFCKPKQASAFEISTPAATCAISGTTGFLEVLPEGHGGHFSFLFGLVEGHTSINVGGVPYDLVGGNLLVASPDGQVHILNFDLASFLGKAGLITHFKGKLPNQAQIDKALKKYLSLVQRGFIKPPTSDGQYIYPDLEFYNTDAGERDLATQILLFEQQQGDIHPKNDNPWEWSSPPNDGLRNGNSNGGR